MHNEQPQSRLTFVIVMSAVVLFLLAFVVIVQVMFDKHETLWGRVGVEPQRGEVRLTAREVSKGARLTYITLAFEGEGAPSFSAKRDWKHPQLNLAKLSAHLEGRPLGSKLPVVWIQPRFGEPRYLEVDGVDVEPRVDTVKQVVWIFLTGVPLLMLTLILAVVVWSMRWRRGAPGEVEPRGGRA